MNKPLAFSNVPMAPSATSTRFAIWARNSLALEIGRVGVMFGKGGRSIKTKENGYAEQAYKSIVAHFFKHKLRRVLPVCYRSVRAVAHALACAWHLLSRGSCDNIHVR